MRKKRTYGDIQPGIHWGPFTLRIPGIHYGFMPRYLIQGGLLLLSTSASVTPLLMQYFSISFDVAWTLSLGFLFWVIAQTILFGDVYISGAAAAALPLTLIYLDTLTPGTEAIHGMIALYLIASFIFFFFGVTKLGPKFNAMIPNTLKAGIILGASIVAIQGELVDRLPQMPFTLVTAWIVVLFLMFSIPFARLPDKKIKVIAVSNALLISLVFASIVGVLVGEMNFDLTWGFFVPKIGETFSTISIWAVGFPPWDILVGAIPLGIMIYLLAFADLIIGDTFLSEADRFRDDEKIDINSTRSHYTLGLRNLLQVITFGPSIWAHGPLWTGIQIFLIDQYKKGRQTMDSIFTGTGNFVLLTIPLGLLWPVISILTPLFPVALSVTLLLTGFGCAYVALGMVSNNTTRGLAVLIGVVTAVLGPGWGIGIGIALYFLIMGKSNEDQKTHN